VWNISKFIRYYDYSSSLTHILYTFLFFFYSSFFSTFLDILVEDVSNLGGEGVGRYQDLSLSLEIVTVSYELLIPSGENLDETCVWYLISQKSNTLAHWIRSSVVFFCTLSRGSVRCQFFVTKPGAIHTVARSAGGFLE
jgi:hypothetical protein